MIRDETLRKLVVAAVEDGFRRNSNDVVNLSPGELDLLRTGEWVNRASNRFQPAALLRRSPRQRLPVGGAA
jgi:hypothetical protein